MIYEEHNRPGDIVASLALDVSKEIYPHLGLPKQPQEIDRINEVYKAALKECDFSIRHEKRWSAVKNMAHHMLDPSAATSLIDWNYRAYTGYHAANPNMSWSSKLLRAARGAAGWPDVGQTLEEQRQFDEFAEFFLSEWDRDGFRQLIEIIEERGEITPWDREVYMREGLVPFDEDGYDPFAALLPVQQGYALRQAIEKFDFPSRPDFPHAKLRDAGQVFADEGWMPPNTPLGTLLEVV